MVVQFLERLREEAPLERAPFHKANLAKHLKRRIEEATNSGFLELNCRRSMLAEVYPGFENLTREHKLPLQKKFERYIEQENILLDIAALNAGLLLTIARYLTTEEYVEPPALFQRLIRAVIGSLPKL
jgi:hypothetical protein